MDYLCIREAKDIISMLDFEFTTHDQNNESNERFSGSCIPCCALIVFISMQFMLLSAVDYAKKEGKPSCACPQSAEHGSHASAHPRSLTFATKSALVNN